MHLFLETIYNPRSPFYSFSLNSLLLVVPFASFLHSFPDCALTIGLQHFPSSPSNSILYELSAYTNTSNVCLVTGVFYCFLLLSLLFSLTQAFQLTICSQLLFSLWVEGIIFETSVILLTAFFCEVLFFLLLTIRLVLYYPKDKDPDILNLSSITNRYLEEKKILSLLDVWFNGHIHLGFEEVMRKTANTHIIAHRLYVII